jgi:hypothetical protein
VPVLERGHQVLDRPEFGWGQSMGRRVRTGRLIVKRTRVLQPSPGIEPTRRQSQEPQERPQRNTLTGMIHGSQDPEPGASVGQTLVRQRESRASKHGEGEPESCSELLHASPKLQDLLLEFPCLRSVTSKLTTTFGALPSHPRAVERGTPSPNCGRFLERADQPGRDTKPSHSSQSIRFPSIVWVGSN